MRLTAAVLLLLTGAAFGQAAPTEHVTVTAAKSRKVIEDFVQSFAAPTRLTGKLARWDTGVCPEAIGLKPDFTAFIAKRIKDVASQVGAPVAGDDCKTNIEIVFTTTPQDLIDTVKTQDEAFLGYADNETQRDSLAKVTRSIQAWYTTATSDLRGNIHVDSSKVAMGGAPVEVPCPLCPDGKMRLYGISAGSVTGSRLGDGMHSSLYHVIIVAEPAKLLEHEIGTLADYIAMLALAQVNVPQTCQPLPSIVNLLVSDCGPSLTALTASDLGYLRGLYHMSPDLNLRTQEDEVIYQMQNSKEK